MGDNCPDCALLHCFSERNVLYFAFIGHTASTYMIAQIISAAITIPFMYFASYKPTQQMFVKKPKIDRALFINVLWIIVITLLFHLRSIISSPCHRLSGSQKDMPGRMRAFMQVLL